MSVLTLDLPVYAIEISNADTNSPARARHWLAWVLEATGLSQDTVDAALLTASELVTNAVVHTDSPRILVSAEVVDGGVRLVVHDDATESEPWDVPGERLDERGRGLVIVRALATEFRIDRHAAGTTVSALIPFA